MKLLKLKILIVTLIFAFQTNAQTQKEEFYRTKKGDKYHKKECITIKKKDTLKISLKDAKKKGLQACKVCKPSKKAPAIKKKKSTNKVKVNSKNQVSTRCTGITQKGARCKRRTKSSDGTCWQH
jgi:hypothetical protein